MIVDAARHLDALRTASAIAATVRRMYRPKAALVKPVKVIRVLNEARVSFVLMGNYGIAGYRDEPQATHDVDILVQKRDHEKAVAAILKAYSKLRLQDDCLGTRFVDRATDYEVIDVLRPFNPLLRAVFRNTEAVGVLYRIPNLEIALACKYAAMGSLNRPIACRYVDAGDFLNIAETNLKEISVPKLRKLGSRIDDATGEVIVRLVDDIRVGRDKRIKKTIMEQLNGSRKQSTRRR